MFYKGEVPFVRLLVPLVLGIISGYVYPNLYIAHHRTELFIILLTIFFILLVLYKHFALYQSIWVFGLIIHAYLFLLGHSFTVYATEKFESNYYSSQNADLLFVMVKNEPKLSNGIVRLETEVQKIFYGSTLKQSSGKLLLAIKLDTINNYIPNYGDLLMIPAVYQEIEPPYNPGEFNYKTFLERKQIYFQSFVRGDQIEVLAKNKGNPIIAFALAKRKTLIRKYITYLPNQEAAALASTLILGYRADLSKEIIEAYSKTGTMHVLSVSGMHVGIVFLVLSALLKPMNKNKLMILIRMVLIIMTIWLYALITGFSAPVSRAAMMISFVVVGKAINRKQNTYNLIAISAFFLLIYNPYYLFDVGFQLSYLAVSGLVFFHPKIYHIWCFKYKFFDYIWSYSALSIAAQLATFPLGLYYFHQFPLYFLISNLLIVLPVTIIMYFGILLLFIPTNFILEPLGEILSGLINLTNQSLLYIEDLPYASLSGFRINGFQLSILLILILSFVFWIKLRDKVSLWVAYLMLLFIVSSFSIERILNHQRKELIFFSLRKNSAIAYIYKGKALVLADFPSSGKLFPFSVQVGLESKGVQDILVQNIENPQFGKYYWSDSNFMQFGNFKVLRWDESLLLTAKDESLIVDILLLSGSPKLKLSQIKASIDFKQVLIDSTNPDYKIKAWRIEAANLSIPCYVLKKSPAYIVKL